MAEPVLFGAMAALHTGLVGAPWLEVVWLDRRADPVGCVIALSVVLGATALRIWTLRTLGRSWNVRVVRPEHVVTDGPYAWIRHPNYLCVVLEIAAIPMLHGAWISACLLSLLNAWVLAVRIRTEESVLRQLPGWREAFADVPRLIPWRRRRH